MPPVIREFRVQSYAEPGVAHYLAARLYVESLIALRSMRTTGPGVLAHCLCYGRSADTMDVDLSVRVGLSNRHLAGACRPSFVVRQRLHDLPGAVGEQFCHRTEIALLQCDQTDWPARLG